MTAKEKAEELFKKYYILAESINWSNEDTQKKAEKYNDDLGEDVLYYWHELAKRSALIAVDEIIKSGPSFPYDIQFDSMPHFRSLKYWEEVKQEIEKL
jgi:hypothetical protein